MRIYFLLIMLACSEGVNAGEGWNNFYYKVVRDKGKLLSVQECKQADRPLDGQIAGYKMVMTNVKKHGPVFYGQSMRTELSFTISPGVTAIEQHFTGALGDLYAEGMKHCKKHLQENNPK